MRMIFFELGKAIVGQRTPYLDDARMERGRGRGEGRAGRKRRLFRQDSPGAAAVLEGRIQKTYAFRW